MPLIEEIPEDEPSSVNSSSVELLATIKQLAARLALPEELLSSYIQDDSNEETLSSYRAHALTTVRDVAKSVKSPSPSWSDLDMEEQGEVMYDILRLYGHDPWTCKATRDEIDDIALQIDKATIALHLLQSLRPLFSSTPHPMLNDTTSRALSHPAGGSAGQSDFNDSDTQPFKRSAAWGSHNILSWAASNLPPSEVEKKIGLILPPTLVLMDDWEPHWRLRGIRVLDSWMDKMDPVLMRRMGIDKLLRSSVIHTMGLHASPPLVGVLPVALKLIKRTTTGKELAEAFAEVVDKGIIQGWTYAPSGIEGRRVLISIAGDLELLCRELGVGMIRWIKTVIPHLLDPLQYIPTKLVLPHYRANLSALLCVLQTIRDTGRTPRWRGQILDVIGKLWTQLDERGDEDLDEARSQVKEIKGLVQDILAEVRSQCPSVRDNELAELKQLDPVLFGPMVAAA